MKKEEPIVVADEVLNAEPAKAYYSIIIENTADTVWAVIRDFNEARWMGDVSKSWSDNEKTGDAVGAVRVLQIGEELIREILAVHSDADRFYTYNGIPPFPVQDYQSTLRVIPAEESNNAYVEWTSTFQCAESEKPQWVKYFTDGMIRWLASLNEHLLKVKNS